MTKNAFGTDGPHASARLGRYDLVCTLGEGALLARTVNTSDAALDRSNARVLVRSLDSGVTVSEARPA